MSLSISGTLGNPTSLAAQQATQQHADSAADAKAAAKDINKGDASDEKLREAFQEFVGKTFYGQLLKSMRKSVGKPAYFHGGRGEEVFRSQLDQIVVERISETAGAPLADSMYDLAALSRRR